MAYLAAVLRQAGHEVHALDSFLEGIDIRQTCQAIKSRCPEVEVLGITATEPETWQSGIAVVKMLRSDGLAPHVTAGGYLPTFWCDELLSEYPEVDSVVVGEGEETLKSLVAALSERRSLEAVAGLAIRDQRGTVVHTPRRELIR